MPDKNLEIEIYTQDYRHFDSLIWQVPAWGSAVFSFSVTAALSALSTGGKIEKILAINTSQTVSVFLFSVFVILLLFTNAFLRFRLHQRVIYRPNRKEVPSLWFMFPGQSSLLFVLWLEATVILWLALITAGLSIIVARTVAISFLIFGGIVECSVRNLSKTLKEQRALENKAK